MGVTLYTSRIVLNVLGIEDYGIYSIVGGVVTLFSFFNAAMSSATQRYLAFDIGRSDFSALRKTFNTTMIIHVGIAILVVIVAETLGLWYINRHLNVPVEKMSSINWVYQFSVLTSVLGILQVPFNALLIAREKMNVFALLSMVDVVLKLIIVFLLPIIAYDKLILYGFLMFVVTLLITMTYRFYCYRNFVESKFKFYRDKNYYRELLSYSGWNLFGNIAAVAKGQGVNLVLNAFFGTIVNAAYGITMQVQNAVNVFVNNFQLAINPQIIKTYSQGNFASTQKLIFQGSKYSFFLMLIVACPILVNTGYVLELWLGSPPPNTTRFVQLCLVNVLIDCVSGSLMTGAQATGKIKWYQIIVGLLVFLNLPISYFVLSFDSASDSVFVVSIVISVIALQFRLFFLKSVLDLNVRLFYQLVVLRVLLVTTLFGISFYFLASVDFDNGLWGFLTQVVLNLLSLVVSIVFVGINREERTYISGLLFNKILRR